MTSENLCSLDESDAIALSRAFEALGSGLREQAVRDLFALGCYVHIMGRFSTISLVTKNGLHAFSRRIAKSRS